MSRNRYKQCEFYECPSGGDTTRPVITRFEITPTKVPARSEVQIICTASDERLDRVEILIFTPSGRTDAFAAVDGRGYFADQQGIYKVYCKARDMSGNTDERTQTFFTQTGYATKSSCPGECCIFENDYEDKFCGSGSKCENRRCEKAEERSEDSKEIPGITTVSQIIESPGKFENFVVTVAGVIGRDPCAAGGYDPRGSAGGTGTPAPVSARDLVTGRATAATKTSAAETMPEQKCFPFFIADSTGKIGLIGFGASPENKKETLKGVVRSYEINGKQIPFIKVEGRSEFEGKRDEFTTTEVMPVFAQKPFEENRKTEICFKTVRKYAIRLTHNEEVQNAFKKNRDLWNYIDQNHQDVVSKLAETCGEEPEIAADYLSRAVQNEISKNQNYGFDERREFQAFGGGIPSETRQPNVVPIIVVTRDVSNAQIEELRRVSGAQFSGPMPVEVINKLTIIRMPAMKENVDAIKKLSFVEDVKVDSVNLIVNEDVRKSFESKPPLDKFEIPRDDLLKKLEAIKSLSGKDDDQASLSESQDSIIQASSSLDEFENETGKRGLGYTLSWVLGAAAEQEKKDAEFLNNQITQLESTIRTLDAVALSTEDITIKASLKEQIDVLKTQTEGIRKEAEAKKKNAGGFLALIRNLFGG